MVQTLVFIKRYFALIIKKLFFILLLYTLVGAKPLAASSKHDITILVSSCDKYSHLWDIFFKLLFQSWPSLRAENSDIPIILVSNTKKYNDSRITHALSDAKLKWTGNIAHALSQVKTKYVLYLQDDYFIARPVIESVIWNTLSEMDKYSLEHVGLYQHYFETHKHELAKVGPSRSLRYKNHDMPYLASLHTSIWKTTTIKELVNSKESSIWDFDNVRLKPWQKFAFYTPNPKPILYVNFMSIGNVRFTPYSWAYYKGYDLSFAENYRLSGKRGQYLQRLKELSPTLAKVVLFISGMCVDISITLKSL